MLDIQADLSMTVDGEPVAVCSEGEAVVASFQSVPRALRVLRSLPFPDGPGRRAAVRTAAGTAKVAGVDVLVRVGRRVIARAGPAARPGWLSRLLRLGEVEVYARQALLAAIGR